MLERKPKKMKKENEMKRKETQREKKWVEMKMKRNKEGRPKQN